MHDDSADTFISLVDPVDSYLPWDLAWSLASSPSATERLGSTVVPLSSTPSSPISPILTTPPSPFSTYPSNVYIPGVVNLPSRPSTISPLNVMSQTTERPQNTDAHVRRSSNAPLSDSTMLTGISTQVQSRKSSTASAGPTASAASKAKAHAHASTHASGGGGGGSSIQNNGSGNNATTTQTPKKRRVVINQAAVACVRCGQVKMKCVVHPGGGKKRCQRCVEVGVECVWKVSGRGKWKRPSKKGETKEDEAVATQTSVKVEPVASSSSASASASISQSPVPTMAMPTPIMGHAHIQQQHQHHQQQQAQHQQQHAQLQQHRPSQAEYLESLQRLSMSPLINRSNSASVPSFQPHSAPSSLPPSAAYGMSSLSQSHPHPEFIDPFDRRLSSMSTSTAPASVPSRLPTTSPMRPQTGLGVWGASFVTDASFSELEAEASASLSPASEPQLLMQVPRSGSVWNMDYDVSVPKSNTISPYQATVELSGATTMPDEYGHSRQGQQAPPPTSETMSNAAWLRSVFDGDAFNMSTLRGNTSR